MLTRIRDAITGQWTTKADGDARPGETVAEKIKNEAAGRELIDAAEAVILGRGYDVGGRTVVNEADLDRLSAALRTPA